MKTLTLNGDQLSLLYLKRRPESDGKTERELNATPTFFPQDAPV